MQAISKYDWSEVRQSLDKEGVAVLPQLLSAVQCKGVQALYADADRFRSRVIMQRHGYGQGEYQYFAEPLPELVRELREQVYPKLAPLANDWAERLREVRRFPDAHGKFRALCHAAGQTRPTPLILHYGPGDYNCLHQDLYGELSFPLQLVVLLSEPGRDFEGGEFLLVEQRPRMQSRARVVPLRQGDAAVFAVNHRPARGQRGDYKLKLRHGIGTVSSGERYALGIIFHDAQ